MLKYLILFKSTIKNYFNLVYAQSDTHVYIKNPKGVLANFVLQFFNWNVFSQAYVVLNKWDLYYYDRTWTLSLARNKKKPRNFVMPLMSSFYSLADDLQRVGVFHKQTKEATEKLSLKFYNDAKYREVFWRVPGNKFIGIHCFQHVRRTLISNHNYLWCLCSPFLYEHLSMHKER